MKNITCLDRGMYMLQMQDSSVMSPLKAISLCSQQEVVSWLISDYLKLLFFNYDAIYSAVFDLVFQGVQWYTYTKITIKLLAWSASLNYSIIN